MANRPPVTEMQNMRVNNDTNVPRREYVPHEDTNHDLNLSKGSSEFHPAFDMNSRPPPGPRYDQFRQDFAQRPFGRQENAGSVRQNNYSDRFDSNRERETVKPGMFRSRTPGPEMMGRGPDYRNEFQRPKTPTAQEMRSKTPLPGHSYGYGNSEFMQGRSQNNYVYMNGPRQGPNVPQRPWGQGHSDLPVSPPPLRRDFDAFDRNNSNNLSQGSAGRPSKYGTSYDEMDSGYRVPPKRYPTNSNSSLNSQVSQSPRVPPRFPDQEDSVRVLEFSITLHKQESGFGFRIIGGTEEGSQVSMFGS